MEIQSASTQETRAFGSQIADKSEAGMVYGLIGELGSGKTEFVRGFVSQLSQDAVVRSPSFSLVNTYQTSQFSVHHFDFYRLSRADELFEIGFDEYLADPQALCLIEWADMFPEVMPEHARYIQFSETASHIRCIAVDKE